MWTTALTSWTLCRVRSHYFKSQQYAICWPWPTCIHSFPFLPHFPSWYVPWVSLFGHWASLTLSDQTLQTKHLNFILLCWISKLCFRKCSRWLLKSLAVQWSDNVFILSVHSTTKWMGFYVGPPSITWLVSLFWHVVADVHLFPVIQTKCWWFVFFKCLS
jgi:hypothetical protein